MYQNSTNFQTLPRLS